MSRRVGPLADDSRQHAAAKADAAYTRQFNSDLRILVASPEGRRFFGRLIYDVCGLLSSPGWTPSAEVHVQAGRRQVGDQLLGAMEVVAPGEVRRMTDEWFKGRYEWRTSKERASGGDLTTDEETDDAA